MHPTRTLSEIERTTGGLNRLYVPNRENAALPILTLYEYRRALKTRAVAYGVYAEEAKRVLEKWEEIYECRNRSETLTALQSLTPVSLAAQLHCEAVALKTRQAIRERAARPLTGGDSSDLTTQPDMFAGTIPTQYPLFDNPKG